MYKLSAKVKLGNAIVSHSEYDNRDFSFELTEKKGFIKGVLKAKKDLVMKELEIEALRDYEKDELFFANGYQSWTTSREYSRYDATGNMMAISRKIGGFAKYCTGIMSDYTFADWDYGKIGKFHSYTYTYLRKKGDRNITLYGSKSERQGFTIFRADMPDGKFVIRKDIDGLFLKAGEEYEVFDIIVINDEFDAAFDKYFFDFVGVKKPKISHLAGYTSWYNYFSNITEDICIRDLNGLDKVKESIDIFQIDDGYQTATGDWLSIDKKKFPHGMKYVADKNHEKGYLAGIWLAPFCAQMTSKVLREHPDWMVRDDANGRMLLGHIGWGGAFTLDIYHPEAREYIKGFFNTILNEWGFDLVKLDFLFTQCNKPRAGKTRGRIMCDGIDLLREACGDKLILGCGVPLGACMGIFDACRISCDANKIFGGQFFNKIHVNNEVPSTQGAINNTIFRNHLDGRAFCNDPDVLFLRDTNIDYTYEQKLLLGKINAACGNVLFVSDNAGDYNEKMTEHMVDFFANRDYKVDFAEYIDKDYIRLDFTENGVKKSLTFNINNGESNIRECL